MEKSIFEEVLDTRNLDPNIREILMLKAEQEYKNGNETDSIFYQIRSLCKVFEERYFEYAPSNENLQFNIKEFFKEMNPFEKVMMNSDPLFQYSIQILQNDSKQNIMKPIPTKINENLNFDSWDFLQDHRKPAKGMEKVIEVCNKLPKEWTVLQICKGFRPETSYSVYPKIHENDAAVFLTVLKHARSKEFPYPICLCLEDSEDVGLFRKFGTIVDNFKECIIIENKDCESYEARAKYWEQLKAFDKNLQQVLVDLRNFVYPWDFLFRGMPKSPQDSDQIVMAINKFCDQWQLAERDRVLLSLAGLALKDLQKHTIQDICLKLGRTREESQAMYSMLHDLNITTLLRTDTEETYPCILILDEYLDHIFWEELNVHQEFTRVNSLQCLWRLYQYHKKHIRNGYYITNISKGSCLLNPDGNLSKTELRMKSFFDYWSPHWSISVGLKPSPDNFFKDYFQHSCYVYAGHGSGLQYVNGRHIAKQRINSVIFLFGCDSSRLHSNGLYSELVGAHLYYHAAMCPTLIGTLMPGLDARMDGVAAEILSRWITPHSKEVMPWNCIDANSWSKKGKVVNKTSSNGSESSCSLSKYQMASLCSIIARVHQRITEQKYYNTVPYVCRGLPAWNNNVRDIALECNNNK